MALTLPLVVPAIPFTGTAGGVSPEVPGLYDIAIGGRGYMIDWDSPDRYTFQTVPLLRAQSDQGDTPGANSINPEGLWRRAWEEWHLGAGQDDLDRASSESKQYRSSKGIDPWTRWELTLLPDVDESLDSSATNLSVLSAGDRLYVADGQSLRFTTDPFEASPTYTAVTGTPSANVTALASTGFRVMAAFGASGIYRTETNSSTASQWISGAINDVSYVKGRVMATNDNEVYEIERALDDTVHHKPSALFTHPDSNFSWVGFAEGKGFIYAAGFSGDKSEIYRITIQPDGTSLTAPSVAARLPDGEIVSSVYGYLGFVLIGTTSGFRMAVENTDGSLTLGSLVETGHTIRAWEGQGQYAWFTWEEYDSECSGLGRIDLANLSDERGLVPAFASDLMATAQAQVKSIATHSGKRVFAVAGEGIYAESANLVETGTIDSGLISFGLSEDKTAVSIKLAHDFAGGGSISTFLSTNEGTFAPLGVISAQATSTFPANEQRGSRHELRLTLQRSSADATQGPKLLSSTVLGYPNVAASQVAIIPILLRTEVEAANGARVDVDVISERAALDSLWLNRTLTTFQEGSRSHVGIVEDSVFRPEDKSDREADFGQTQGTATVRFKIIEGAT